MFNPNTAQENDQVIIEVKGKKVTGIIDQIRPHTINWNQYIIFVTVDEPVAVWNETDIREGFSITHDIRGNENSVVRLIA